MNLFPFRSEVRANFAAIHDAFAQILSNQQKELKILTALDDTIAKIQTDVSALTAAVSAAVANINAQTAQIATLTQELAGGQPITQAQIDQLNAIATSIESETSALNAASPAQAPAAPAAS